MENQTLPQPPKDINKDIHKDANTAGKDANTDTKTMFSDISDTVKDATQTVKDATQKVGAQAAEAGDQVYKQAADTGRYVARQIEEQPVATALIIGGIGLLIGFVLGRESAARPRSFMDYADDYLPRRFRQS